MTPNIERIHLLMFNATGFGGVARSVNTLASQLAETHEVHVHSLLRNTDNPQYPIDPRVHVHWLLDNRKAHGLKGRPRHDPHARPKWRQMDSAPSALEPDPGISAYTDRLLRRALARLSPGVLITTRPMLHLAAAKWAPGSVLRIAQDHLNYERRMRNRVITAMLDEAIPTADAFVTLTKADHQDYQRRYPATPVKRIPNPSPYRRGEQATLDSKVVVSAGRLVGRKGFDRLVAAWAPLAGEFPDWQLHIYGEGECRDDLQRQIDLLGTEENVHLKGYTHHFDRVLAGASIYAMSSRIEGFPMVLLEAMSHGLPLISFDCPRGPAEVIDDGENGRLVKHHDSWPFTEALRGMIVDEAVRRDMGQRSYEWAKLFEVGAVAQKWESLFEETLERRITPKVGN
jgi:glycosyltransferase involved in cell wall biosynthesis